MRVCGFTIVRNGIELGYPFEESIRSLLPLVDELVVAVGDGSDGTWQAVQAIGDPKIEAFATAWDPGTGGGHVLARLTNLALERCRGTWAVYLQADEVLHEDDVAVIRGALEAHERRSTEGLTFEYRHFFGSYDTVADDWRYWCPRAIRAVRLGRGVRSVGDAAGFRIFGPTGSRGLIAAPSRGRIFHYGWCRGPAMMCAKQTNLDSLYTPTNLATVVPPTAIGSIAMPPRRCGRLKAFAGTHPRAMAARVAAQDWSFDRSVVSRASPRADRRRLVLEHARRFVRYFLPPVVKNACWRVLDAWRVLTAAAAPRA